MNRFKRKPGNVNYDDSFLAQRREFINMNAFYTEAEILNRYIVHERPAAFRELNNITLEIFSSAAGDVPVITLGNASDFEDFTMN